MNRDCPCGRQVQELKVSYEECCAPFHRRQSHAPDAESLMRSRFSAFQLGEVDYLLATHRPPVPEADPRASLEKSMGSTRWLHLDIVHTSDGRPGDSHGEVEFIATFEEEGRPARLQERSRFQCHDGRWFYIDGHTSVEAVDLGAVGRNDPCWCGSGKKRKKCHR